MSESEYVPPDMSLRGQEHVRAYRKTGGEVGYLWNGVPTLLLTTTGRRSGLPRTSALIFGRDGDDYLVVASVGGMPNHPAWFLNLRAAPNATIQVKNDVFTVTAAVASPADKPRLWAIMTNIWPNYNAYQARTERAIPLVTLRRRDQR